MTDPVPESPFAVANPELPVNNLSTMLDRSPMTRGSPAVLATVFAGIAVLLTAVGMYGVLGYAVALRCRELGLRIALDAQPSQIRRAVVGMAARLLISGALIGVLGAWMTGRAMGSLLCRVAPISWPILAGASLALGAVCLAACLVPSWRASGISPVETPGEG